MRTIFENNNMKLLQIIFVHYLYDNFSYCRLTCMNVHQYPRKIVTKLTWKVRDSSNSSFNLNELSYLSIWKNASFPSSSFHNHLSGRHRWCSHALIVNNVISDETTSSSTIGSGVEAWKLSCCACVTGVDARNVPWRNVASEIFGWTSSSWNHNQCDDAGLKTASCTEQSAVTMVRCGSYTIKDRWLFFSFWNISGSCSYRRLHWHCP